MPTHKAKYWGQIIVNSCPTWLVLTDDESVGNNDRVGSWLNSEKDATSCLLILYSLPLLTEPTAQHRHQHQTCLMFAEPPTRWEGTKLIWAPPHTCNRVLYEDSLSVLFIAGAKHSPRRSSSAVHRSSVAAFSPLFSPWHSLWWEVSGNCAPLVGAINPDTLLPLFL